MGNLAFKKYEMIEELKYRIRQRWRFEKLPCGKVRCVGIKKFLAKDARHQRINFQPTKRDRKNPLDYNIIVD